jgi:CrcB protein
MLRYIVSVVTMHYWRTPFPLGTWVVNLAGCLIIGLLTGFFDRSPGVGPEWKMLFITGFCGGFTTFSAFAVENLRLLQTGHTALAVLYMAGSVLTGLLAAWGGWLLAK